MTKNAPISERCPTRAVQIDTSYENGIEPRIVQNDDFVRYIVEKTKKRAVGEICIIVKGQQKRLFTVRNPSEIVGRAEQLLERLRAVVEPLL